MVPPNCIFELRKCLRRFCRERQRPVPENGGSCRLFASIVANFPGEYNPQCAQNLKNRTAPEKALWELGFQDNCCFRLSPWCPADGLAAGQSHFPDGGDGLLSRFCRLALPAGAEGQAQTKRQDDGNDFFMLDPHSLSCAAAEKRNSARRNDLTGRDTPGHYIQHTVFFREKPLTGCIGFEIFLMGWGVRNGKLVFADQF